MRVKKPTSPCTCSSAADDVDMAEADAAGGVTAARVGSEDLEEVPSHDDSCSTHGDDGVTSSSVADSEAALADSVIPGPEAAQLAAETGLTVAAESDAAQIRMAAERAAASYGTLSSPAVTAIAHFRRNAASARQYREPIRLISHSSGNVTEVDAPAAADDEDDDDEDRLENELTST